MPRSIAVGFKTYISGETFAGAVIVKLTRLDGTIFGFTTWDQDITYNDGDGSVTYEANNAFVGSAVKQSIGANVDNMDVQGLISSTKIAEEDIVAGKYDTAKLKLMFVIPTDLGVGHMTLLLGTLGDIKTADGQYTAELRSLSQKIAGQVGQLTSPTCRVRRLGDLRCAVGGLFGSGNALTFYRVNVTVVSASNGPPTVVLSGTFPAQVTGGTDSSWYNDGILHMLTGNNAGVEREIKTWSYGGGNVTAIMHEGFGIPLQAGDTGYIEAGCDRTIGVCNSRFNNAVNFRGEPYIPGLDKVLQQGDG